MKKLLTLSLLLFVVLALGTTQAFGTAKITIVNNNAPNVGFNDPTPVAPVGGNLGTTLGQQRLNAFNEAARVWGETLDSPVEIRILASFEPLSCTATAATLGSAGTISVWRDFTGASLLFPGAEFSSTWYHAALADKMSGIDLDPTSADLRARFNINLGNPGCLTGSFWYLGYDTNGPTGTINLVSVLLHEFAHGLGFAQFANVSTGALFGGLPDTYNRRIFDNTLQTTWDTMTNAQRAGSAINPRRVVFLGDHVTAAVQEVLQEGVPQLQITAPAGIAGYYSVGEASFGAPLSATAVTGQVVAALDTADAAGPTTFDACSPITNAADVAGKIAIVNRGTCGFVIKAKNVQNAGAIAMLVHDNAAGGPPAGMSGVDPTVTIPSVRITLDDGNLIRAQLGAGVQGSLSVDTSLLAGADPNGKALLYTPNPVAPGSTISHFDTIDRPNQLMEPSINSDLTHNVKPPYDMTLPLLRDVGWFPDIDNDGLADGSDACANSDLTAGEILIGSCNTTVNNVLFTNGCTIQDYIKQARAGVENHGGWVSNMAHLGEALLYSGIITETQKDAMQSCAARTK